jgi:hypothetical protein
MINFLRQRPVSFLALTLLLISGLPVTAQDVSSEVVPFEAAPSATVAPEAARSEVAPPIAPQLEALKESVLTLNRDLLILEEELLYPASSQVAIYVSMDIGQYFALDAVKVEVDNQLVASELYTDKQVSALFRGGVQRIYIGNLKSGEHEIAAFFTGRGPQQDYKRGAKLTVKKNQAPLVLELRIIDSSAQLQPVFEIKEWQL